MMGALAQFDLFQPSQRTLLYIFPRVSAEQKGHCHILQRGKLRHQVVELPDEAYFAVTKCSSVILRERTQSQVGAVYVTCGRPIKSAEDVQQGTLSSPRLADDREHLAFGHMERQVFKEHQVQFARAKDLFQTLNTQNLFLSN